MYARLCQICQTAAILFRESRRDVGGAAVARVLTESELVTLGALAETLGRKGLTEERDVLLGVIGAGSGPRELRVAEAAALARRSSQTIRNWIKAGWLPARTDGTNHYYVPLDALLPMVRMRAL